MSGYPFPFLSQLHPGGSGQNDCYQASLGAYLLTDHKLAGSLGAEAILDAVSMATRGTPDEPNNPDTTLYQAELGLTHYGLAVRLTTDWVATLNNPWAILLVDGTVLTKVDGSKPYPASWFNGAVGPDHFILWGPPFAKTFDWIMNPLDPAGVWARYNLDSVRAAFSCAYLLPAVPSTPTTPPRWRNTRGKTFGLLTGPAHGRTCLTVVPAGGTGIDWGARSLDAQATTWARLQFEAVCGWAPAAYIAEDTTHG